MRVLITLTPLVIIAAGCAGTGQVQQEDGPFNGYEITQEPDSVVIGSMTSPVYQVDMSRAEIIAKAETCANRHLSVGSVATSGGSEPVFDSDAESGMVQGGSVVQQVSPEQGVLVARGRTEYKHALISHSAQSTLFLEAKDGRFRITHEDLGTLQKDTGYVQQDGFNAAQKRWGTGWKNTLTALQEMEAQVTECIQSQKDEDW